MPGWLRSALGSPQGGGAAATTASPSLCPAPLRPRLERSCSGSSLTIYLLIEGRQNLMPGCLRSCLSVTGPEPNKPPPNRHDVIWAYVVGNAITSAIAFAATLLVLWLLKVPAALLLAVMRRAV